MTTDLFQCQECYREVELNIRGKCEFCQSDAVISLSAIRLKTVEAQQRDPFFFADPCWERWIDRLGLDAIWGQA